MIQLGRNFSCPGPKCGVAGVRSEHHSTVYLGVDFVIMSRFKYGQEANRMVI